MSIFVKTKEKQTVLQDLLLIAGGAILLFAASQVDIPLKPVPITLQTVGSALIGLTYSPRRALGSHLLWIGAAALGLPVLHGFSSGIIGPTAGYIFGMAASAYGMSLVKQKFDLNSFFYDTLLTLMGTGVVFFFGILWLAEFIGLGAAITQGLLPFILPGIAKAGVLCLALQAVRQARRS